MYMTLIHMHKHTESDKNSETDMWLNKTHMQAISWRTKR